MGNCNKATYSDVGDDVVRFRTTCNLVDVGDGLKKRGRRRMLKNQKMRTRLVTHFFELVLFSSSDVDLGPILGEASGYHFPNTGTSSGNED